MFRIYCISKHKLDYVRNNRLLADLGSRNVLVVSLTVNPVEGNHFTKVNSTLEVEVEITGLRAGHPKLLPISPALTLALLSLYQVA
ncbi:hypothetical protein RRG08_019628 [Elysia crispata]|uniref:Uncharacterized protein n=1 Tax=Elysia crispata TaxID=231223 RepID=A0AAE1DL43_9GAST|nr:hypothetical protein RRG08_019628 [Elysia crispata]